MKFDNKFRARLAPARPAFCALLSAVLFALSACGGDDDDSPAPDFSPEALHGGNVKEWRPYSSYYAEIDEATGDTLYSELDVVTNPCLLDNRLLFAATGEFEAQAGRTNCSPGFPDPSGQGTYAYDDGARRIQGEAQYGTVTEAFVWDVLELTEDRLVVREQTEEGDGVEIFQRRTLVK